MAKLVRLERWSDRESNGGTRLDFCKVDQVLKAEVYRELSGREELDLSIDPAHAWATSLAHRNVIRTVFADDAYDEWRAWSLKAGRSKNGARGFEVLCRSIKFDLGDELVAFPQANGQVLLHHELADLAASDFLAALAALATWPADFTVGTVEPTTRHTWITDWDPYLSILTEAGAVSSAELDVRRDGTTGYVVDLLGEVRAGERTEIRFAAGALESEVERDWAEAGTLIYPKGEGPQGAAPGIGDMRWFSDPQAGQSIPTTLWRLHPWDGTARASGWIALLSAFGGLVCTEDDQYNGLYFGRPGATDADHQIVDSAPAEDGRAIDVTFAGAIARPPALQWLLADADGNELLYLPVPSRIATHGRKALVVERDDIPGVTNLVTLPFLHGKEGVHWDAVGSPVISTLNLASSPFVHYGTSSVQVEAAEEEGLGKYVSTKSGGVIGMTGPHLSFQVYGHLISGSVRFEVLFDFVSPIADGADTAQSFRFPSGTDEDGAPIEARAVAEGAPFHLTIEPQRFNFSFQEGQVAQVGGIQGMELRVTAREPGTVFVLDAWQVVNHPLAAEKIVAGASAARLWDAACRAIEDGAADPAVTLRTTLLDFDRLGRNPLTGAIYTYGAIHPGVTARIVDAGIGLEEERRIRSVRRDLLREALTAIELVGADSAA